MMLSPATPASGATFCHSSSVMKGMMGWARRSVVSSTRGEGAAGGALLLGRAGVQLHLGEFQIPVAVFVPDEFVDGARGLVEAVGGEGFVHFGDGLLQACGDPAVGVRKVHRQAGVLPAVVAFQVHQREAGGVPQLVAEVAVALGALQVELDVAAVRGQTREGEAQGIGAEGGDALGELACGCVSRCRWPAWDSSGPGCAWRPGRRPRCRRSGRSGRARCPSTCSSSGLRSRAPGR